MQLQSPQRVISILIVVILGLLGLAGWQFWQLQHITSQQLTAQESAISSAIPSPSVLAMVTAEPSALPPTITFDPDKEISSDDKDALQSRVIDPFLEYYRTLANSGQVTSITIKKASAGSYPYSFEAKFNTGVQNNFVVSRSDDGSIDWWLPECLIQCPFTDEFKTKFPEIVAKFE